MLETKVMVGRELLYVRMDALSANLTYLQFGTLRPLLAVIVIQFQVVIVER